MSLPRTNEDPVGGFVILHSGRVMDMHFSPEQIILSDIAQGLSLTRRWGGQANTFYSVAQHSVLIYEAIRRDFPDQPFWALWALLHDAAEAYIGDVPRPFKQFMPDFIHVEALLLQGIADKFDMAPDIPHEVKRADHDIIWDEAIVLFDHLPAENMTWLEQGNYQGIGVHVDPWPWEDARRAWLVAMRHALDRCDRYEIWQEEFPCSHQT